MRTPPRRPGRPASCALRLEALEDRNLLSAAVALNALARNDFVQPAVVVLTSKVSLVTPSGAEQVHISLSVERFLPVMRVATPLLEITRLTETPMSETPVIDNPAIEKTTTEKPATEKTVTEKQEIQAQTVQTQGTRTSAVRTPTLVPTTQVQESVAATPVVAETTTAAVRLTQRVATPVVEVGLFNTQPTAREEERVLATAATVGLPLPLSAVPNQNASPRLDRVFSIHKIVIERDSKSVVEEDGVPLQPEKPDSASTPEANQADGTAGLIDDALLFDPVNPDLEGQEGSALAPVGEASEAGVAALEGLSWSVGMPPFSDGLTMVAMTMVACEVARRNKARSHERRTLALER